MEWNNVADALPTQHKRVLAWYGHPMFAEFSVSTGWSFDFENEQEEVTHFCEISGPAKGKGWIEFKDFIPKVNEVVILWFRENAGMCAYLSDDPDDPERDKNGWVYDFRFSNMGSPTHVLRIKEPTE